MSTGEATPQAERSRGTLIPALLGCATIAEALPVVLETDVARYRPFRLLLIDEHQIVECWPDHLGMTSRGVWLEEAEIRTSSSLGDDKVAGPRLALFDEVVRGAVYPRMAQDQFHAHQWPAQRAVSVRMSRAGARTVSSTVVEVSARAVRMTYRPIDAPDSLVVDVTLPRANG
jgi:hypothetical protein